MTREQENRLRILILCFSATGNTRQIAEALKEQYSRLGASVDLADITSLASRRAEINLESYEAVVLGAPVHSARAPRVLRQWLLTLDGKGKRCSMFFTYGGFGVGPAHYSTRQILEQRNFVVVASAQFLSAHTFNLGGWKAMEGRPDAPDFDAAKDYATRTFRRFTGEDRRQLGDFEKPEYSEEKLDSVESFRFKVLTKLPSRDGEDCGLCMECEQLCPVGAMDAEAGRAEDGKCIACLGCVDNCPEGALKINDMTKSWLKKLEMEKTTAETLNTRSSRLFL